MKTACTFALWTIFATLCVLSALAGNAIPMPPLYDADAK